MTGSQERFQQAMNQGHSAAWDQSWDKAVAFYRQALAEFPDHPKALTSLGLALLELDRNEEALECYRKASLLIPNDPILLEKVAQICERLGRYNDAIQALLQSADLHMKGREVEKAVENWVQVTHYNGDHLVAHSRLAVIFEKMGRRAEAVQEYLWVASIVQRTGADDKALQAINYALQIMPDNAAARQAMATLRSNALLPRPPKGLGGTGPVKPPKDTVPETRDLGLPKIRAIDPVSEARHKALTQLAGYLFEQQEEHAKSRPIRRSAGAIMRGAGEATPEETELAEQAKVLRFLGQAIEEQTQGLDALAMVDLQNAMDAGLSLPAAHFNVGLLASVSAEEPVMALQDLRIAMKHADYALASHIVAGQILRQTPGRTSEAASHYLEALKLADAATAPPAQAEDIKQLYDPVIAGQISSMDEKDLAELCDNVNGLLSENEWRANLTQARLQLPPQPEGNPPLLLAEMLLQTRSTQVVESLSAIRRLADHNLLRTAMEEAFTGLQYAPTYLPLHTQIGDILLRENRYEEAIQKYGVVAHAYSVRGEAGQAVAILRKLIQLAPSDLTLRQQMIEQLTNAGQADEAVKCYMDLADIYYHQMDLDKARATYVTALRLVQNSSASRDSIVEILNRMADIDLQRLDLRGALRIYEQVRNLRPTDPKVRMNIIATYFRIGQEAAARAELENFFGYMDKNTKGYPRIGFLKALADEHPELADFARAVGTNQ